MLLYYATKDGHTSSYTTEAGRDEYAPEGADLSDGVKKTPDGLVIRYQTENNHAAKSTGNFQLYIDGKPFLKFPSFSAANKLAKMLSGSIEIVDTNYRSKGSEFYYCASDTLLTSYESSKTINQVKTWRKDATSITKEYARSAHNGVLRGKITHFNPGPYSIIVGDVVIPIAKKDLGGKTPNISTINATLKGSCKDFTIVTTPEDLASNARSHIANSKPTFAYKAGSWGRWYPTSASAEASGGKIADLYIRYVQGQLSPATKARDSDFKVRYFVGREDEVVDAPWSLILTEEGAEDITIHFPTEDQAIVAANMLKGVYKLCIVGS